MGLKEAAAKSSVAAASVEKSTAPDGNPAVPKILTTGRPAFDAKKVADIRLQFLSGDYHVDTDALAVKILNAAVLEVHSTY